MKSVSINNSDAIFEAWFEQAKLDVSRDVAKAIYDTGLTIGSLRKAKLASEIQMGYSSSNKTSTHTQWS